jgi:hypothetical protein
MQQTGDEYPPNNLVDNLLAILTLKQQNNQTNTQWYEKLNTRVDVAESVGVELTNFTSLWSYCCDARGWGDYATLTADEQLTIRNDSKERLLSYLLIANSSNTSIHESVKNNLLEAYIAKRDEYPSTRSEAIALLNKYDEKKPPTTAEVKVRRLRKRVRRRKPTKVIPKPKPKRSIRTIRNKRKATRSSSKTKNALSAERKGMELKVVPIERNRRAMIMTTPPSQANQVS